ncbi:MraY family glycosyltransferase [Olivibacter jilunii]|uniref:MraY family glycosyltransferase n=1 Tax=Olivibacter jilunii TaxID=985016 RepID=UPI003F16D226
MTYLFILGILLLSILVYFRIADHFNIIDKPNHRSSHTQITIRGGGVVFYFAGLCFFCWSEFEYPLFFLGLTLMALISFLDDVYTLSNKVRIGVHLIAVLLLLYQLQWTQLNWLLLPLIAIAIIGIINAYNFMDGINGITAMYSFAVLALLWIVNNDKDFVDERFLYCVALGNLVFTIFNFRQKAKCFAGDVGSVSMAFILIFLLSLVINATGNPIYLLFLSVYGVDTIWTIIRRLYKGENIFEAHRSHLYQYLANEAKINKLFISFSYGFLQVAIGVLVVFFTKFNAFQQTIGSIALILALSMFYWLIKWRLIQKYQL